ncbi:N-acetylglucosamine-6-phosphate deacetylase [Clostridium sporogenes]|uniref:N-acetylglucosamine-6-phosphate deacetylase n=1 Tax=Clostridium sporogenes TaxID=1509 RepID=A0A7U4JQU9_CLOSG|nr:MULTISPECIES: N-acetylglucosamine-6-phosphate deacetylase [Clostridium]STC82586.1 N-acetylglucosamine-6-phosphate deacetylase [Clostridium botulinum]AKC63630.1 N-acetylglucosamine-6-phosphate deacetylase NagA [Clostridium sporogenes]AKJ90788.1 N-acetylglucosamine-6-phosphate deacetylase [Clostridium sporogenes]EHN14358.1 N-acetylglucosamine-6-phosphate deacetylase [Clostridium sporogenes PA 3679]KCZ67328.1 N-acetylglucosamine-6-phosphate deacetylase NagA [Clostridium sporogenes]
MKAIVNGKIIVGNEILQNKVLLFEKKIIDILDRENVCLSKNDYIIDAKGLYISPGFIDVHIHGSGGKDVMDGEIESIKVISNTIAKRGVTSFLPTTMTMAKERIYKALDVIEQAMNMDLGGAKVLGAHLEGPFINPKYKGAQKVDFIKNPSFDFIKGYENVIKIITLAPEKDENFKFLKYIKENTDIVLSIGHSDATYEQAMAAIDNGISRATHTFNAMTPLNHRKPGIIGAIMNTDISCELIADNIHVHKGAINVLTKIKGKDKIILITDSMRAGCMNNGIWELGGQKVIVKNGSARLEDNTLAGSILTLDNAIKNMKNNIDASLCEIISMVTINPAKDINIYDKKGSIEKGKDSDIVIFDKDINISMTIVEGNIVYQK